LTYRCAAQQHVIGECRRDMALLNGSARVCQGSAVLWSSERPHGVRSGSQRYRCTGWE